MTLYVLLARLTDDGQRNLLDNPGRLNDVIRQMDAPDAEILARYAVLGQYDFLLMVEARDHQAVARLSLQLGARAGLHFETLPAIPMGLLAEKEEEGTLFEPSYEPEPTER